MKPLTDDEALIFLHIPKTAGSTLHTLLNGNFPARRVRNVFAATHDEPEVLALAALDPAAREQIRLLKGHMPFGLHRYLPQRARYMTVLREPVARVISQYFYVRRNVQNPHHAQVISANMSLGEFVSSGISPGMNDGHVRWLTDQIRTVPFGRTTAAALDEARANISEHFALVGMTERFDETILLLRNLLGWKHEPTYERENVARTKHKDVAISTADIDTVREFNQLDIQLYNECVAEFDRRVEREGVKQELAGFRQLNQQSGVKKWMTRILRR